MRDEFQDQRKQFFVYLFALKAERFSIGADDSIFDEHFLLHLPLFFDDELPFPFFSFFLLLPGLEFLGESFNFFLEFRDSDYFVLDFFPVLGYF